MSAGVRVSLRKELRSFVSTLWRCSLGERTASGDSVELWRFHCGALLIERSQVKIHKPA